MQSLRVRVPARVRCPGSCPPRPSCPRPTASAGSGHVAASCRGLQGARAQARLPRPPSPAGAMTGQGMAPPELKFSSGCFSSQAPRAGAPAARGTNGMVFETGLAGPPSSHRRAGHGPQELQPSQGHREEVLRRDWELAGHGVPVFVCWTTVAVSFEQGGSGRPGISEPSAWGGDTGIQLPPAPTWGTQADAGPSSRKPQTLWLLTILATWGPLVSSLPHFPGWSFLPSVPHTEYLLSSFIGPKISLAGKEWDTSAHVPWSGCALEHERQGPHCSSRQLEKVHGRE